MKLKVFLISIFAITNVFLHGQNKIQGYILDKQTSEPLAYATIGALHQQYGTYTDTSGLFTLYFLKESDSLKISYLGYKSLYTCVGDLQRSVRIHLEPDPVQLKEVAVSPKKKKGKVMEIGFFTKKQGIVMAPHYSINMYASFIPFPEKGENVLIKSVKFTYKMASINYPLRIRILTSKTNGEPGEDIITENIVYNNYLEGERVVGIIDVTRYNVFMLRNGVFIALEWLDFDRTPVPKEQLSKYGPFIGVIKTSSLVKSDWINNYNQSKWKVNTMPYSNAIGLTVVNYKERY
jgi:hypothetical protein